MSRDIRLLASLRWPRCVDLASSSLPVPVPSEKPINMDPSDIPHTSKRRYALNLSQHACDTQQKLDFFAGHIQRSQFSPACANLLVKVREVLYNSSWTACSSCSGCTDKSLSPDPLSVALRTLSLSLPISTTTTTTYSSITRKYEALCLPPGNSGAGSAGRQLQRSPNDTRPQAAAGLLPGPVPG